MELSKDEIIQNTAENVVVVQELLFSHTNMNGLAFHVDIT